MDQYNLDFLKTWSYEIYNICRQAESARIARETMTEDQYFELLRVLSKVHIEAKREKEQLGKEKEI